MCERLQPHIATARARLQSIHGRLVRWIVCVREHYRALLTNQRVGRAADSLQRARLALDRPVLTRSIGASSGKPLRVITKIRDVTRVRPIP